MERLLREKCASVAAYDNLDGFYRGKENNLKKAESSERFKLIRADILDQDSLSKAIEDCQVVFHLAGQAGVRYCNENPLKANQVNVHGTLNVLNCAKQHKVEKLVYASSSSIYGDPAYLPMDEKHPTNPNSPYGVSKLAAEQYCRVFSQVFDMDIASLRYFSVYGPRGRPDQVIYAFAQRISERKQPVIFGDGNQTRDFTFVSDVVDATILASQKDKATGGEAFNIGHGSRITINELVKKIINGMGLRDTIEPVYAEKSKGDFPDTEANNEKAKHVLGWNPKVNVTEGLKLFFDWFLYESEAGKLRA